jgi:hypothetical protein
VSPMQTEMDPNKWQRHFAVEFNNRAWRLSEAEARSQAEAAEMLSAAHAAAYLWGKVGAAQNVALAEMLLGHVHAFAGHPALAMQYAQAAYDFILANDSADWEIAFAHAVLAHAAAAAGDQAAHREHYEKAKALGAAMPEEEDRYIFNATFRRIPAPSLR